MNVRKRYLLLILIALLPLINLIHCNDYCFGVKELLIITGFIIFFIIVFLVILFNNFYNIALKRELFNYRPVLIAVVYFIVLSLLLNFHDENVFKTKIHLFETQNTPKDLRKLLLFSDNYFELKVVQKHQRCIYSGSFSFKEDTLRLKFHKSSKYSLDTLFNYSKNTQQLLSLNTSLKLKKVKDLTKKENYIYISE